MEITEKLLRENYSSIVTAIEESAVKKLTEAHAVTLQTKETELETLRTSEKELKTKVQTFEAEQAQKKVVEGIKTAILSKATELKIDHSVVTEARLNRATPYLTGLEEAIRGTEIAALLSEWAVPVEPKRPFGPNAPAPRTAPPSNGPTNRFEGYVPADADGATVVASLTH